MDGFLSNPDMLGRVIAAVKDESALNAALKSEAKVIFILKCSISSAADYVKKAKAAAKKVFIHIDLMEGLGRDDAAIEYIADQIKPDGIITVRAGAIKKAAEKNLQTILRVFLIDSQGIDSAISNIEKTKPSAVEIMPGIMPSVTTRFASKFKNIIVGGLVSTKEEIAEALRAGAVAASTSREELWR